MRLGNFSLSLAVTDLHASGAFNEKLGFKMVSGDRSKNWVVLQNDATKIGLFQGMFPRNVPGRSNGRCQCLALAGDTRNLPRSVRVADLDARLR